MLKLLKTYKPAWLPPKNLAWEYNRLTVCNLRNKGLPPQITSFCLLNPQFSNKQYWTEILEFFKECDDRGVWITSETIALPFYLQIMGPEGQLFFEFLDFYEKIALVLNDRTAFRFIVIPNYHDYEQELVCTVETITFCLRHINKALPEFYNADLRETSSYLYTIEGFIQNIQSLPKGLIKSKIIGLLMDGLASEDLHVLTENFPFILDSLKNIGKKRK